MAYGRRSYRRRYSRRYGGSRRRRPSYRKSYRKSYSKARRPTKRAKGASGLFVPVPNQFYQLFVTKGEGKQLKAIFKRVMRVQMGGRKVPKKAYKQERNAFMADAILSGLTGKIWALRNAAAVKQDKMAMDAAGMGAATSGPSDEPVQHPEAAATSQPSFGPTVMSAAEDMASNFVAGAAASASQAAFSMGSQAVSSMMTPPMGQLA